MAKRTILKNKSGEKIYPVVNQGDVIGLSSALSGKQNTLTSTQLEAVNSGINSEKVDKLDRINEGSIGLKVLQSVYIINYEDFSQYIGEGNATDWATLSAFVQSKWLDISVLTTDKSLLGFQVETSSNRIRRVAINSTTTSTYYLSVHDISFDDLFVVETTNKLYRNITVLSSGTSFSDFFTEVSKQLSLGTTAGTAYEGSAGATNRTNIETLQSYFSDGVANSALKATNDANGNSIASTYATKNELSVGLAEKQHTLTAADSSITIDQTNYTIKANVPTIQMDDVPTSGSSNAVKSNGIYTELANKQPLISSSNKLSVSFINGWNQANWNETDSTSPSYIQNKPTIPEGVIVDQTLDITSTHAVANKAVVEGLNTKQNTISSSNKIPYEYVSGTPTIPTKTSDLTNDSDFITRSAFATTSTAGTVKVGNHLNIDANGKLDVNVEDLTGSRTITFNSSEVTVKVNDVEITTSPYTITSAATILVTPKSAVAVVINNITYSSTTAISIANENIIISVGETVSEIPTVVITFTVSGWLTKTEGDAYYASKSTTVNGHPLSSDVTVTKSDLSLENVTNVSTTSSITSGSSSNITSGAVYTMQQDINTVLSGKQATLTAGTGISITTGEQGQTIITATQGVSFQVVVSLPATGQSNVIYLVPLETTVTGDIYAEYIWVNNAWEKIGTTLTSLDGYVKETRKVANLTLANDISASDLRTNLSLNNVANVGTTSTITAGDGQNITSGAVSTLKTSLESSISGKQDALPGGSNDTYLHKNASTGENEWIAITKDYTPTSGSNNVITSGAVYTATQGGIPTIVNDKFLHTNSSTGALEWSDAGAGTITDVQVNGTSVVTSGVANVVTNTAYDASSNKIATMSDLPQGETSVTLNGTATSTTETLTNIVVDTKTYTIPAGTTYTAGTNIAISNNVISACPTISRTSNDTTTVSDANVILAQDDYSITIDQGGAFLHQTDTAHTSTDAIATIADATYIAGTGITVSNNTITADLTYTEEVTITGTGTNVTINGVNNYSGVMDDDSTLTLNVAADGTSYKLPTTITVSGANYNYSRTSDTAGTITISSVTGNVSFSISGEPAAINVAFTLTWQDDYDASTCYIKVNGTASSSDYDYTLVATASYTPVSTTINILSTDTVNILCGMRSDGGAVVTNCSVSPIGTANAFTFSDFTSSTATASMHYLD